MKTKLFLLFGLLTLLLSSFASANSLPYVIHGNVVSGQYPVLNAELEFKGLVTGVTTKMRTNENGFFQFDLGNLDPSYRPGDRVRITLLYCASAPECQKEIVVEKDRASVRLENWDIQKISQQAPSDVVVVKYQCQDGSFVDDKAKCPAPKEPEPVVVEKTKTQYQCLDGSFVDDKLNCPEESNSWVAYVVGVLVLLFGGAGGFKFYNGKFKHLHRGVVGYHDPNTVHSNPKYRHRTWKESPLGCIRDVKKIQQGIDLSVKEEA